MVDSTQQEHTADTLHDLPNDGNRYELIEGELVTMSPTGYQHGMVELNIGYVIRDYLKHNKIGRAAVGEVGFRTRGDNKTVRAADVVYIAYDTLPTDQSITGYLSIAPDLVVEVISPHDRTGDVDDKTREWLDFGGKMVWNVYPTRQQVHIYAQNTDQPRILFDGDTLDGGDVLPGFSVEVVQLFAD